jgi:hypothetical protein
MPLSINTLSKPLKEFAEKIGMDIKKKVKITNHSHRASAIGCKCNILLQDAADVSITIKSNGVPHTGCNKTLRSNVATSVGHSI